MLVQKDFALTTLEKVTPGELIVLDLGGRALCIAMGQNRDEMRMHVLILKSTFEAMHPCWFTANMLTDAVSFGSDWVLELGGDTVVPGNRDVLDGPGTVLVWDGDILIRAAGDDARIGPAFFSLQSFAMVNRTSGLGSALYVRNWKVWKNEAERSKPGGRPIFEFADPSA